MQSWTAAPKEVYLEVTVKDRQTWCRCDYSQKAQLLMAYSCI